jgi:hypothetical protein
VLGPSSGRKTAAKHDGTIADEHGSQQTMFGEFASYADMSGRLRSTNAELLNRGSRVPAERVHECPSLVPWVPSIIRSPSSHPPSIHRNRRRTAQGAAPSRTGKVLPTL